MSLSSSFTVQSTIPNTSDLARSFEQDRKKVEIDTNRVKVAQDCQQLRIKMDNSYQDALGNYKNKSVILTPDRMHQRKTEDIPEFRRPLHFSPVRIPPKIEYEPDDSPAIKFTKRWNARTSQVLEFDDKK